MTTEGYWTRAMRGHTSRRRMLQGSALAGLGLAGAALVGCGGEDEPSPAPATGSPAATRAAGGTATATAAPESAVKRGGKAVQHITTPHNDENDPHKSTSQASFYWQTMGNTGTRLSQDATEVLGELIESWEQVSDTELVMKTRQGAKWHDKGVEAGRAFDAEDAAFNLLRITGRFEPDQIARFHRRSTLDGMAEAEAVDATTVKVTFSRPTSTFLAGMTDFRNSWISKEFVDAGGDFNDFASMVGTGPWIIDRFENEVSAHYVRNPNYWKEGGLPYLDEFEWVWIPDATSAIAALSQDQISYFVTASKVQRETVASLASKAREETVTQPEWIHVRFNTLRAPLDDPRVRKAIQLVPRWSDMAQEAHGEGYWGFVGPLTTAFPEAYTHDEIAKMPGWNPSTKEADIKTAVDLMTAAGFPDGALSFRLMPSSTTQGSYPFDYSVRVQDQLKAVWPAMTMDMDPPADNASFGKRQANGDFDALTYSNFPQPDPVLELTSQYHNKGSRNYGKFADADIDRLLEDSAQQLDAAERKATLREVQDLLINDHMPMITINTYSTGIYFQDYVRNMENFMGKIDHRTLDLVRYTERMWFDK